MSFSNVFKAPFFKINWVTKCVEDYFLSNEKTLDLEKYNMTLSDRNSFVKDRCDEFRSVEDGPLRWVWP